MLGTVLGARYTIEGKKHIALLLGETNINQIIKE